MSLVIHNDQLVQCTKNVPVFDVKEQREEELKIGQYVYRIRGWIDDKIATIELMGDDDDATVEIFIDEKTMRNLVAEKTILPKMEFREVLWKF